MKNIMIVIVVINNKVIHIIVIVTIILIICFANVLPPCPPHVFPHGFPPGRPGGFVTPLRNVVEGLPAQPHRGISINFFVQNSCEELMSRRESKFRTHGSVSLEINEIVGHHTLSEQHVSDIRKTIQNSIFSFSFL